MSNGSDANGRGYRKRESFPVSQNTALNLTVMSACFWMVLSATPRGLQTAVRLTSPKQGLENTHFLTLNTISLASFFFYFFLNAHCFLWIHAKYRSKYTYTKILKAPQDDRLKIDTNRLMTHTKSLATKYKSELLGVYIVPLIVLFYKKKHS